MYKVQNKLAPARIQNLFTHMSHARLYPFLQHQMISNYQQILCHVFSSWTTKEFIFPIWSAVMECFTRKY